MTPAPKKHVLVTGASRGIGREVARQLALAGDEVFLGVRSLAKAPEFANARPVELDVSNPRSIEACARRLASEGVKLEVLLNNAGVYEAPRRELWATNLLGPILLTRALDSAGVLAPEARVVNVSSGLGAQSGQDRELVQALNAPKLTIDDLLRMAAEGMAGTRKGGYGATKAALNAFTRLLVASGRHATSIDPGWVQTEMGGRGAPRTLAQGAASVLFGCRLGPAAEDGGFWRDGQRIPW
jgi:NAD(P)-dependent dehydrogenase (short-subunit alcohol dehydrogenase family)